MRVSVRAIAGGAALALTLGACGVLPGGDPSGDPTSSERGGTVIIGGCQPGNPLVPAATNEVCGGNPLNAIFSMLVRYDPQTGEAVNDVAQSITSEDNKVWRIELEPGWTFHDGSPITASSFVDAWNWGAHGANAALSQNSYFYSIIEGFEEVQGDTDEDGNFVPGTAADTMSGLEVIDDTTFEVTLKQAEAGFPQRLGYIAYAPLPETFFDAGTTPEDFGASPIGSGPFEFVEFVQGERIVLEAYEGYQGEVRPNVDGVTFEIFENQDAQYASLLADQVDVMTQLPTSALAGEAYKTDLGDRYIEQETGVIHMMGFPSEDADPNLADPRVRQAISMSIDRQLIIDNIFQGIREPASSWVSPVVDGYTDGQCGDFCTFNPDRARELLAETDFDGELTITYNEDGDHETWVNATCNNIKNVLEIECTPQGTPTLAGVLDDLIAGELTGMFRIAWQMDYPSIENFLGPLYQTGAGANFFGHNVEQFDSLIAEASGQNGEQSVALFQEAERMLAQTMPTVPLWFNLTVAGYSTRVDNVIITPFGTVDLLSISVE